MIDLMEDAWRSDSGFRLPQHLDGCGQVTVGTNRQLGEFAGKVYMIANHSIEEGRDAVVAVFEEAERRLGDESAVLLATAAEWFVEPVEFVFEPVEFVFEPAKFVVEPVVVDFVLDEVFYRGYEAALGSQIPWFEGSAIEEVRARFAQDLMMFQDATLGARRLGWVGFDPRVDVDLVAAAAIETQIAVGEQPRAVSFEALGDALMGVGRSADAAFAYGVALGNDPDRSILRAKYAAADLEVRLAEGYPAWLGDVRDPWTANMSEKAWLSSVIGSLW